MNKEARERLKHRREECDNFLSRSYDEVKMLERFIYLIDVFNDLKLIRKYCERELELVIDEHDCVADIFEEIDKKLK